MIGFYILGRTFIFYGRMSLNYLNSNKFYRVSTKTVLIALLASWEAICFETNQSMHNFMLYLIFPGCILDQDIHQSGITDKKGQHKIKQYTLLKSNKQEPA